MNTLRLMASSFLKTHITDRRRSSPLLSSMMDSPCSHRTFLTDDTTFHLFQHWQHSDTQRWLVSFLKWLRWWHVSGGGTVCVGQRLRGLISDIFCQTTSQLSWFQPAICIHLCMERPRKMSTVQKQNIFLHVPLSLSPFCLPFNFLRNNNFKILILSSVCAEF